MGGGTGTTCKLDECFLGPAYVVRATKLVQSRASRSRLGFEVGDVHLTPETKTTDWNPEQHESDRFCDFGQPVSLLDIIQCMAAVHDLGHLMLVGSQPDWIPATQHITFRAFESSSEASADWGRWHELLSIRDSRPMNPSEQREYEKLAAIVAEQDAQEEIRSSAAVTALKEKHAQVLSSIERLTEAILAAASRLE